MTFCASPQAISTSRWTEVANGNHRNALGERQPAHPRGVDANFENINSDKAEVSSLATVATSGLYADLSGTPSLATVATTGSYSDLSGLPTLGTAAAADTTDFDAAGTALALAIALG